MIPIQSLFESHLTVADLRRSMLFYGDVLGLELAQVFDERKVAFYWVGARRESMLGLWEVGTSPQKMVLHVAFRVNLQDLLDVPARLTAANVIPRDFDGNPTEEPVVLAWMPAASLYCASMPKAVPVSMSATAATTANTTFFLPLFIQNPFVY